MTFEQWTSAASTIGVPAVLLAAMGLAAWKAGRWVATEVIKPVSQRHITFLDTLEAVVGKISATSSEICDQIKSSGEKHDTHSRAVLDKIERNSHTLDAIHQIVKK